MKEKKITSNEKKKKHDQLQNQNAYNNKFFFSKMVRRKLL